MRYSSARPAQLSAPATIKTGALEWIPRLRFCFAHGGGVFPFLLGRLLHGWRAHPEAQAASPKSPSEYLGTFYYDSITHDPAALRFLVETVGAERVVMGSDYPFVMGLADPVASLAALPAAAQSQIMEANARQFLGVSASG